MPIQGSSLLRVCLVLGGIVFPTVALATSPASPPVAPGAAESKPGSATPSPVSLAAGLQGIDLVATSPADQRAVVRNAANVMSVVKPGDRIPGSRTTVKEILADRLVLEGMVTSVKGLGEKQTAFLFWAATGQHSRVEEPKVKAPPAKIIVPVTPNKKRFYNRNNRAPAPAVTAPAKPTAKSPKGKKQAPGTKKSSPAASKKKVTKPTKAAPSGARPNTD